MARREWADKIVKQEMTGYHWNARIKKSTVILPDIAAKLLVKERYHYQQQKRNYQQPILRT